MFFSRFVSDNEHLMVITIYLLSHVVSKAKLFDTICVLKTC